jgi:crotonobetainyl-CoA:carnitine CoA-transferase CaiB-like acyl-CoA transferase
MADGPVAERAREADLLEGLKVVEFSTYVAGPSAAMVMADWGAQVIKIESKGGDPTRYTFAAQPHLEGNPVFEFENRGKRGAVIDIAKPAGREALIRILKGADIFITNLRPSALKRAKLDYDSVRAQLPGLIYCSVSGYGLEGAGADAPAFDIAAFWTRSGVGAAAFPRGVEPFPCPAGMGDEVCALATVSAVLAAVVEKATTGTGRLVETSLMRAGVFAVGWQMSIQLKWGKLAAARPRKGAFNPLSNYFPTADGRWLCTVTRHGADDWTAIAAAAGRATLLDDPRFATAKARSENVEALVEALDEGFLELTLAEAGERLAKADVIWAPLQAPRDVVQDPFAIAAGCFVEAQDGDGRRFLAPASPARFPGANDGPTRPAPALGQHTREVLAEAGYAPSEIDALIDEGAVV